VGGNMQCGAKAQVNNKNINCGQKSLEMLFGLMKIEWKFFDKEKGKELLS
jgi:hypothetical protein